MSKWAQAHCTLHSAIPCTGAHVGMPLVGVTNATVAGTVPRYGPLVTELVSTLQFLHIILIPSVFCQQFSRFGRRKNAALQRTRDFDRTSVRTSRFSVYFHIYLFLDTGEAHSGHHDCCLDENEKT